jgi:hypothetical protein
MEVAVQSGHSKGHSASGGEEKKNNEVTIWERGIANETRKRVRSTASEN